MFTVSPYGLDKLEEHHGDGSNRLRTETSAQPWTLKPGDWLANRDRVLHVPSEAGNSGVKVWLTGGHNGHEIEIPSRIPVALGPLDTIPIPRKSCDNNGHNPFHNSGFCARCGADVPVEDVTFPFWAPARGPWCLKRWVPYGTVDTRVDCCLLGLNHEGDCRGIHGDFFNDSNGLNVGQLPNRPGGYAANPE